MNIYSLIKMIQDRMQDPVFAAKFNEASAIINNYPGLQQEVLRIAQIQDGKAQSEAISRLPKQVKDTVRELIDMLNKS